MSSNVKKANSKASSTEGSVARDRRESSRSQNSEVICGSDRVEEPEAWRIRERVFRRCDRRKGLVWDEFSPLDECTSVTVSRESILFKFSEATY